MEEELFSYEKPGIVRGESCLNGIVNEDAGCDTDFAPEFQ